MLKEDKPKKFDFELAKEIKKNPSSFGKKLLEDAEKRGIEIKDMMRKGADSGTEYDQLGMLLHANAAMQKVIKKLMK